MKYLIVEFSDRKRYAIPTEFIADELFNWASNNMDWKDVKDQAILLETKVEPTDYDKEWTNAKMVIEFIKPSELDDSLL